MLDIGWSELLVIAIVAIVVVGPKDLPRLMRTFGVYAGKLRRTAADFQRQFREAMAESEADEVAKNIEAIRANMGTRADFGGAPDKPVMTSTPAPQSIEQAITPPPAGTQTKRTPRKKASAGKASAKKAAAKKAPAKKAQANRETTPRTAAKKTTARTLSRNGSATKKRPKR